jgi:uncharacterized membrane protein
MLTPINLVLILAAAATALMAGLFFAWSCSVMPGIGRLPDATFLSSMQAMNRAILNPAFFSAFFGALLLLPLSAYLHYHHHPSPRFWLLVAASILYGIGVFGITMVGNVPLNDRVDAFPLSSASASDMAAIRAAFEEPWNQLNTIRTLASTVCIVLVIIACLYSPDTGSLPADRPGAGK